MKIVLLGGTGYLGSHVAEQCVLAGHAVNCLVRSGSRCGFLQSLQADERHSLIITEVDFQQAEAIHAQIDTGVTVVNCLAETRMHLSDDERRKVEVTLTGSVFMAAQQAGAKRFVQLSTVMAYGFDRPEYAVDETYPTKPKYSYSRIAVEREQTLLNLQQGSGVELAILRPSNTLGKRDSAALPSLMAGLEKGVFSVIGGGAWNFSCMDARDVGRAMEHLLRVDVPQPEIYLAKAYDITWLDVKEEFDKQLGKTSKLQNVPKPMAWLIGALMELFTPFGKEPMLTRFSATVVSAHTLFDDTKIRNTGFEPRYDLRATLVDALSE